MEIQIKIEAFLNSLTFSKTFMLGWALAFIYWLAFYDNGDLLQKRLIQERKNVQEINIKINKKKKEIEALQTYQSAKKDLGARFEQLIKYIPKDFNTNEQMRILVKDARSSGASIVEIKKSSSKGRRYNFYEELLVDVRLRGTYSQIVLFLSYLTKRDKVIILKNMKLKAIKTKISGLTEGLPSLEFKGQIAGFKQLVRKNEK